MNYELIKNEFIELKKEELKYVDNVAKISSSRILTEYEKLEIYRKINDYQTRLYEILERLRKEVFKNEHISVDNLKDVIIEFDVDKSFLSLAGIKNEEYKKHICRDYFGVDLDTSKFRLTLSTLMHTRNGYRAINPDMIQNNQKLIENTIYIFCGYYDSSEDCYGPCFGNPEDYIYGTYADIRDKYDDRQEEIPKKKINDFEKDKTIIHSKRYVHSREIRDIFEEELLNIQNKSLDDCVVATRKRIEELNYVRSPEYKEKVLLDKINELYQKVKGEFIQKEVLYNGGFLEILKETYKLPNEKTVEKEKVIKNGGKNSVIIIAITQDKEYIITFQNRIKDEKIAEFPSGYIENGEDQIEAARRELQEETGYVSDDLFIVDEAFTSPGIDNSITYIVIANNCIKTDEIKTNGTELVNYGLFSEVELKYLISNNIMNGAMNKLAYYNLVNNVDDCNVIYSNSNKKIYKMQRKKTNPLYN